MISIGQRRLLRPIGIIKAKDEEVGMIPATVTGIYPSFVLVQFDCGFRECYPAAEIEAAPLVGRKAKK